MFTSPFLLAIVSAALQAYSSPTPGSPLATTSIPLIRRPARRFSSDDEIAAWLKDMGDGLRSKYGATPSSSPSSRKRGSGSNQLIDQNADSSYFGTVAIGTPAISFNVILDTGSADLWLASSNCYTGCGSVASFDSATSSTFTNLSTTFEIKYGSGAAIGNLGTDNVQMAGFGVTGQTFGVCNQVTSGLLKDPVSGLMGLGWSTIASSRATPFWETLASTNAWDQPLMAFHLNRFNGVSGAATLEPGGSFDMGFTNTSLYTGSIQYTDIPDGDQSYWLIPLTQIGVQGQELTLTGTVLAAIDTGTTLVGGPSDAIAQIFAQVPGAQPAGNNYQGYWAYPCDTEVTVSLTFGTGPAWSINPNDFELSRLSGGYCIGAFFELNLSGTNSPTWIIGDTFLKNVYSVFRYNPPSVGFANLSAVAVSLSTNAALPTASVGTGNVISGGASRQLWISGVAVVLSMVAGLWCAMV